MLITFLPEIPTGEVKIIIRDFHFSTFFSGIPVWKADGFEI